MTSLLRPVKYSFLLILMSCILSFTSSAQEYQRWQQRAEYSMKIDFDVQKHRYNGEQTLIYYNNSPDTLHRVFYHLYYNAFQPGSMMDIRSLTISDPDGRVGDRISKLKDDEIGYQKIKSLTQNGRNTDYEVVGTILEVELARPIPPGSKSTFEMEFEAQVPVQIRRTGRDNREGIDYSMSQWYPKMCEYDSDGWHPNPYVGREFYGIWGDFDVEINIDDSYTVAAGGVLKNADKIGRGYSDKKAKIKGKKICWRFEAENVHDFMWAADRDYVIESHQTDNGVLLYFAYQPGESTTENWRNLPRVMDKALDYIEAHYGEYPYPVYSFIQGGDGGMEYPMGTLITGERSFSSLVGVSVHEWMHSWYQMMLGMNEAHYAWMDEGFTSFGTTAVMNELRRNKLLPGEVSDNPFASRMESYANFALSGNEEALSTHADHFTTNRAYGVGSYVKGQVLLAQLAYIIGEENRNEGLLKFYEQWRFKHPTDKDFFRVMERQSDMVLDWYREYFVNTTHTIDYAINGLIEENGKVQVHLKKLGTMPMPVDLLVRLKDGTSIMVNIPLEMMRGSKPNESDATQYMIAPDWPWTHPDYILQLDIALDDIESVTLDPHIGMADTDRTNNIYPRG